MYEGEGTIGVRGSPDGRWLALRETPQRIWQSSRALIMSADGAEKYVLGEGAHAPLLGIWSPEASYYFIGFEEGSGDRKLRALRPGAGPVAAVSDDTALAREPISIFQANRDFTRLSLFSSNSRIFVADLRADTLEQVASAGSIRMGGWSPDGRQLLYSVRKGVGLDEPMLLVHDAVTGVTKSIVEDKYFGSFTWTRDGLVAYTSVSGQSGLYVVDPRTEGTTLIYGQEKMASVLQTDDGKAFVVPRNGCWQGCGSSPIDVTLFAGGVAQTLPYAEYKISRLSSSSFVWGGGSVVRADSSGSWQQLDELPDSIYRSVEPSPDGKSIAFMRTVRQGPRAFEVSVRTGEFAAIDIAALQAASAVSTPTPISAWDAASYFRGDIQVSRDLQSTTIDLPDAGNCGQHPAQPQLSPGGNYVAWLNPCLGGVALVDIDHNRWAMLAERNWCYLIDTEARVFWKDEQTLVLYVTSTLC